MKELKLNHHHLPVKGVFRISRSALTHIEVIRVEIIDGPHMGRGECRPYARYDETPESVSREIECMRGPIEAGLSPEALQDAMAAGAARNALDCALWDLRVQKTGREIYQHIQLPPPRSRLSAYTISLGRPETMAEAAQAAAQYPCLKIKIGTDNNLDAIQAVLQARPDATLIVDANEAMPASLINRLVTLRGYERISLIEQPLRADDKTGFDPDFPIPICADEALHTRGDLPALWEQGYRAMNIKLDKSGGFSEAIATLKQAKEMGFMTMAGCMVASSLAMAPIIYLESLADVIDLDGPLLLEEDYTPSLTYKGAYLQTPPKDLWGEPRSACAG